MRCQCTSCPSHQDALCPSPASRLVASNTRPGSFEGRLRRLAVCAACYRETWAEQDLRGSVWEHILPEAR
jgi:hypothetical protein